MVIKPGLKVTGVSEMLFVVFGSTGQLGGAVINELVLRNLPCRAIVRNKAKATWGAGVEVREADLTKKETLSKALEGASHVIMTATGFSLFGLLNLHQHPRLVDGEGCMALIDAVKERGCKLILTSSLFAAHPRSWNTMLINTMTGDAMHWKAISDQYCRDAGIPYCIVRPSRYNDECKERNVLISQGGLLTGGEIRRENVARVLIDAALSDHCTGCTIDITASTDKSIPFESLVKDQQ